MECRGLDPLQLPFAVSVFGDGGLPEILLSCLQFRLVVELAGAGRATESQLLQLRAHLMVGRCAPCRARLYGRPPRRLGQLRLVTRPAGADLSPV